MDVDFFEKELLKIDSEDKLADFCRKLVLHGIPYVFKNKECLLSLRERGKATFL